MFYSRSILHKGIFNQRFFEVIDHHHVWFEDLAIYLDNKNNTVLRIPNGPQKMVLGLMFLMNMSSHCKCTYIHSMTGIFPIIETWSSCNHWVLSCLSFQRHLTKKLCQKQFNLFVFWRDTCIARILFYSWCNYIVVCQLNRGLWEYPTRDKTL